MRSEFPDQPQGASPGLCLVRTGASALRLNSSQLVPSGRTDLSSIDPTTHTLVGLFNPRIDDWSSHFEVVGSRIIGRTPEGRVTVELLQMNRQDLVQLRRLLAAVGRSSQS